MRRVTLPMVMVACGFGVGMGLFPHLDLGVRWPGLPFLNETDLIPVAEEDLGEELVFVVVGSSGCRWSNSDQFEKVVREGWRAIRRVAAQRGVGFAAMGISQDAWPEQGIEYLKKFGKLDEISVGRGWRNAGILKNIYGDFPGRAATPQVLVLDRALVHEGGQWRLESERVLIRKIGIAEMDRWIAGGGANCRRTDAGQLSEKSDTGHTVCESRAARSHS